MVFTGLIQQVGKAVFDCIHNKLYVLAKDRFLDGCNVGDSIAVNGCCLTLTEKVNGQEDTVGDVAIFFVMEETRLRTNLLNLSHVKSHYQALVHLLHQPFYRTLEFEHDLFEQNSLPCSRNHLDLDPRSGSHPIEDHFSCRTQSNGPILKDEDGNWSRKHSITSLVHLEKALDSQDRLNGHVITGHIDRIVTVSQKIDHSDGSTSLWIDMGQDQIGSFDHQSMQSINNLIVSQGSIALDGVSLTVAQIQNPSRFRVSLIPYTLEHTHFYQIQTGDQLNVEWDALLKWQLENCLQIMENSSETTTNEMSLNNQINSLVYQPSQSHPEKEYQLNDDRWMRLAINLGDQGRSSAPPNPWVGCVIVNKSQQLIGQGFHRRAGYPHAEVEAINDAISQGYEHLLHGATFYVTLEPCCHFGRTPPCCDLLISKHPSRIVVAISDPDIHVKGRGIEKCLQSGIEVTVGVQAEKAKHSLAPYLYHRQNGRPWVVLKLATSLDGKIAMQNGNSKWITGEESRRDVHLRWRSTSQAIMIGRKTAELDHPQLTIRHLDDEKKESNLVQKVHGEKKESEIIKIDGKEQAPNLVDSIQLRKPIRVVIATQRPKLGTALLDTTLAPTLVFTHDARIIDLVSTRSQLDHLSPIHSLNQIEFCHSPLDEDGMIDLNHVLNELGKRGVLQILVEGGAKLAQRVLARRLAQELVIYQSPIILGQEALSWSPSMGEKAKMNVSDLNKQWQLEKVTKFGQDVCSEYRFQSPLHQSNH